MNNEIWFYEQGYYKAYFENRKIKNKLDFWKDCRVGCQYYYPQGKRGWDYILDSRLYNKVAKLLGLPLKLKNKNRVLAGKQSKVARNMERYDLAKVNS